MALVTTIRTGRPEDLPAIGHVLAHAFDEPVTHWLVPDPLLHPVVMPPFFTELAGDALADGLVDVLVDAGSGELLGAAAWFDLTDPHASDEGETEIETRVDDRWAGILGPDADRWTVLDDLMTRHHLPGPHWYLMAIGVRPDMQRHGLGSQLLIHRHGQLDEAVAYLEATSLDSRRLYLRHGYADLGELRIPGGPSMWRMRRPGIDEADVRGFDPGQHTPVS